MDNWIPKTDLGKQVLSKQITDISYILDNGMNILEAQITDTLLPGMEDELLMIGQSKGKFGGGRRRVFRQTQKKTREGNKPQFAAYAAIGNGDGIVGLGYGKARETVPARDKAIRKAKINVFKIARGSGSWESMVKEPHTIPFAVQGSCGSVTVQLFPAPKGKGLVAEKEIQKILKLAGVQDVWSRTFGQTKNKINLIKAVEQALRRLATTKLRERDIENLSVVYGPLKSEQNREETAPSSETWDAHEKKDSSKEDSSKPAKKASEETSQKSAPKKEDSSSTSVTEVKGVGAKTAELLQEAGYSSAEKLAKATPEELQDVEGVGESTAKKIIASAKKVGDFE